MKKIFALLAAIMLFASCSEKDYETTITYRIYYPGNTVTKTCTTATTETSRYLLGSYKGTNYLVLCARRMGESITLESTTAPIQVVEMTREKK